MTIQRYCSKKGISNRDNFNYKIILAGIIDLKQEGGIGITDLKDYDEIYFEYAGLDLETIKRMRERIHKTPYNRRFAAIGAGLMNNRLLVKAVLKSGWRIKPGISLINELLIINCAVASADGTMIPNCSKPYTLCATFLKNSF